MALLCSCGIAGNCRGVIIARTRRRRRRRNVVCSRRLRLSPSGVVRLRAMSDKRAPRARWPVRLQLGTATDGRWRGWVGRVGAAAAESQSRVAAVRSQQRAPVTRTTATAHYTVHNGSVESCRTYYHYWPQNCQNCLDSAAVRLFVVVLNVLVVLSLYMYVVF